MLEGVETWYRGDSSSKCLKVWENGGRKFKLECQSNEASRFLLCLVQDMKAKKYCLVFLERKSLVVGWFLLVKKLRTLGVSTPVLSKAFLGVSTFENGGCSFKRKRKGKEHMQMPRG